VLAIIVVFFYKLDEPFVKTIATDLAGRPAAARRHKRGPPP
jgi:hypothetical protein